LAIVEVGEQEKTGGASDNCQSDAKSRSRNSQRVQDGRAFLDHGLVDEQAQALGKARGTFGGEELQNGVQKFRFNSVGHVCVFVGCVCRTPTGNHTGQPPANFAQAPSGAGCAQIAKNAITEQTLHRPNEPLGIQDLAIHITGGQINEARRQIGDQRLKTQALFKPGMRAGVFCIHPATIVSTSKPLQQWLNVLKCQKRPPAWPPLSSLRTAPAARSRRGRCSTTRWPGRGVLFDPRGARWGHG